MIPAPKPLRPHQTLALDMLDASFASGHTRPIIQAPTGYGKTRVAAEVIERELKRGNRVAFAVPALSLIDQAFTAFAETGIPPERMGVIQGDHPWRRPHAPVQICSAQTLARRKKPLVDLVIVDEAHIQQQAVLGWMAETAGPYYGRAEHSIPLDPSSRPVRWIGLSATPWASGMGRHWDDLLKPTSLGALTDQGYLVPMRVYAPTHPDLTGVRTLAGDYHEGQLAEAMSGPKLVGDVVETWVRRSEGRPTLCYAVNLTHARKLEEAFAKAGVRAGYVDAATPREERTLLLGELRDGRLQVVVNVGTLTTGVDAPWVSCISMVRPTKSKMLFLQILGRGLRTADGKGDCLVLDHSDNHVRLGFATDIDQSYLDCDVSDGKRKAEKDERSEPLPWSCKDCHMVVAAGVGVCPGCGFVRRPMGQGIKPVAGELVELLPDMGRGGKAGPIEDELRKLGKEAVWRGLLWLAMDKGRSKGWASHNYRDAFGVWPRGLGDEAEAPHPLVVTWVRKRGRDYAQKQKALAGIWHRLTGSGLSLRCEADRLMVGPGHLVTDEARALIAEHRDGLMKMARQEATAARAA